MKNKKGFTIVELMAVIVILGLLSTIAVMSVTRYKQSAIEKERVTLRQNVISSFGMYRIDNGTTVGEDVSISLLNGNFGFNGERCDVGDDSYIKFVYASPTSKKEIYCVKMYCNGVEVINDSNSNSLCN